MQYWNVDFSVKKNFRITERFSSEFQVVFTNFFNHDQFGDPSGDYLDTSSLAVSDRRRDSFTATAAADSVWSAAQLLIPLTPVRPRPGVRLPAFSHAEDKCQCAL